MYVVRIKVQSQTLRENLVQTLGMAGYKVWAEDKPMKNPPIGSSRSRDYFVCFENPTEVAILIS